MELLDKGVTVVTPARHLARVLKDAHTRLQMEKGRSSWRSVDILDWNNWCRRSWDRLLPESGDRPLVLNQTQEQTLWLQVIRESRVADRLLQIPGTANQVRESYRVCKSWQIDIFPDDVYLNDDAFHFLQWVNVYKKLLAKNTWIDRPCLPDQLIARLQETNRPDMADVAFYGFDQWLPQQGSVVDALKASSENIIEIANEPCNQNCVLQVTGDRHEEIEQAARWTRDCLVHDPDSRIGIVMPHLEQDREAVDAIFRRQLCIESLLTQTDGNLPYAISQGMPLADYPLVASAMHILALAKHEPGVDQLCVILKSPFIRGYQAERSQRALLDSNIRMIGEQRLGLKQLLWLMDNTYSDISCPQLSESLHTLDRFIKDKPARLLPGEWIIRFSRQLKIMGWPGDHSPDSSEYQTLEAWKKALDDMATLDLVSSPMDCQSAMGRLAKILAGTGFQPETGTVPIHIMGPEGAAAMGFDRLWVTGLHDQDWPPVVQTLPFIPVGLQRQAGITSVAANTQLIQAGKLLYRLVESSPDVVLSYACTDKDRVQRPSPLLQKVNLTEHDVSGPDSSPGFYQQLTGAGKFEKYEDRCGPAISPGVPVTGGSSLFKDQALCPFRGFSRHRLHAESIDTTDIGLNARDRGQLVHRALQLIWNKLKSSNQLRNTSASVLDEYIQQAVRKAIQQQAQYKTETFTGRFRQLEESRLARLVKDWLLVDLERPAFTVAATEKGHHVIFAGILLSMRLDRVDELPDGRLVIIDYKTGNVSINDWEGERPSDPQLPLYAVTCDGEVAALVYASLKTGAMKYIGLSQEDDLLPGCSVPLGTDWNDKLAAWRDTLNKLGSDFINGDAVVDPKNYTRSNSACRYCDLHALCRIDEKNQSLSIGDLDE